MKIIKIFLGSSIIEFKDLRNSLSSFIDDLNRRFEKSHDFSLKLFRCDDGSQNPYITKDGTQCDIDRNVIDSDICLFIFGEKLGEFTKGEFDLAFKKYSENGNNFPKIAVYFKKNIRSDNDVVNFKNSLGKDMKYYYTEFDKDSIIKLSILVGLNIVLDNVFKLEIDNDVVLIDGDVALLNLEDIPQFKNNENLTKLKYEYKILNEKYLSLKILYSSEDTRKEVEDEYIKICSRKKYLENAISDLQDKIFKLSSDLMKQSLSGSFSERIYRAKEYLDNGDYDKALVVMDIDDIKSDYELEIKILEKNIKSKTLTYISELELRINILNSMVKKEDRFSLINETYLLIIDAVKKYGVRFDLCSAYLDFLCNQNEETLVIEKYVKSLLNIFEFYKDKINDSERGDAFFSIASFYDQRDNFELAEHYYMELLDLDDLDSVSDLKFSICMDRLCTGCIENKKYDKAQELLYLLFIVNDNFCKYDNVSKKDQHYLIRHLVNLAIFKSFGGNLNENEYLRKAKKILLENENTEDESYLDDAFYFYYQIGSLKNCDSICNEEYLLKAEEIIKKLIIINPSKYMPDALNLYKSLGRFYLFNDSLCKAVYYFSLATVAYNKIEVNNLFISENIRYEYHQNIGDFFLESGAFDESEKALLTAKNIIDQLVGRNRDKYCICLAIVYGSLGRLYSAKNNYEEAETYFSKSIKILEELNYTDNERNLNYAIICYEFGNFCNKQDKNAEAVKSYLKAIDICRNFQKSNHILTMIQFLCLSNISDIYTSIEQYALAEEYYLKAVEFNEKLLDYSIPKQVINVIRNIFNGLLIFKETGRNELYLKFLTEAVTYCDKLFETNESECYKTDLIYNIYFIYGKEMKEKREEDLATTNLMKSYQILEKCFSSNPEMFRTDYFEIMNEITDLLNFA